MVEKYKGHIKEELLSVKWSEAASESDVKNALKLNINDEVATVELVKTAN